MTIKKAVFVVAGFGTRFLPATKAQPKEMLPIVDKPIIQYLVEEAVEAGISEIIFVTGRGKSSIENHFDRSSELEMILKEKKKFKLVEEMDRISNLCNFAYVRQPVANGDGAALLCAKPFLDPKEPILVVYPDYLMPKENNSIKNIISIYEKYGKSVVCGDIVPKDKVSGYGVIDYVETEDKNVVKAKKFVEKPKVEEAPSNLISAGYFVITPEIIKTLETAVSTTADGELRLADAFVKTLEEGNELYVFKPDLPGFDCGSIIGFLKATVALGLEKEDLKDEFLTYLEEVVKKNK
jgi:UTP--glucose-1-phosphate uridylyltransferase